MNGPMAAILMILFLTTSFAKAETSFSVPVISEAKTPQGLSYYQRDSQGRLMVTSEFSLGMSTEDNSRYSPSMIFQMPSTVKLSFDSQDRLWIVSTQKSDIPIEIGKARFRNNDDSADWCHRTKKQTTCELKIEVLDTLRLTMKVKAGMKYPKWGGNDPFDHDFYRKLSANAHFQGSSGPDADRRNSSVNPRPIQASLDF